MMTWVDGSNPEWRAKRDLYRKDATGRTDARERRFRDWDNLRYLFRGIEAYAPWVHHIYIITPGFYPKWLNTASEKITVINQDDLMPAEFVPTFNNVAIELNMHKIPGLSEHFVYFCDDMFINRPVNESDFFVDGLPCDNIGICAMQAKYENGIGLYGSDVMSFRIVARQFSKAEIVKKNWRKIYSPKNGKELIKTITTMPYRDLTGFSDPHVCYSYLKSSFEEVWSIARDDLMQSCSARFRNEFGAIHWAMRYWQICNGRVHIRSRRAVKNYEIHTLADARRAAKHFGKGPHKLICLNDVIDNEADFPAIKKTVNVAFDKVLPEKCSFEKND